MESSLTQKWSFSHQHNYVVSSPTLVRLLTITPKEEKISSLIWVTLLY